MKFIKSFFRSIIILAVVGFIAIYWIARTDFAARRFAEHIASRTGLKTEIGASRVTWRGVAVFTDLKLAIPKTSDDFTEHVDYALIAPSAEWKISVTGHCKSLRLIRPEIRLVRTSQGVWNPVLLKEFHKTDTASLPAELTAVVSKFGGKIIVEDAIFTVTDCSENGDSAVYGGVGFYFKPLNFESNTRAAYGKFTAQRIKHGETELTDFKTKWLAIGTRIISLNEMPVEPLVIVTSEPVTLAPVETPAPEPEPEEISRPAFPESWR